MVHTSKLVPWTYYITSIYVESAWHGQNIQYLLYVYLKQNTNIQKYVQVTETTSFCLFVFVVI